MIPETAILWEFLSFAVRWVHVITAIAWIGSSFYFIALDLGLQKAPDLPKGAHGEEWQVHGGGFYHIRKYLVAPERMPEHRRGKRPGRDPADARACPAHRVRAHWMR